MYPHPTDPYNSWSYHNDMLHRQYMMQQQNRHLHDRRDFRNSRTLSTERLDQAGGYPSNRGNPFGYRQGIEEEFLSQPNPTFVPPMAG